MTIGEVYAVIIAICVCALLVLMIVFLWRYAEYVENLGKANSRPIKHWRDKP